MTDRELLELAAKATGLNWITDCVWVENGFYSPLAKHERIAWNPLADDGDALRLLVKLNIDLRNSHPNEVAAQFKLPNRPGWYEDSQDRSPNPYAATRRAIVRAAAEIGRNT